MKIGRFMGVFIVALFLVGIAISVYAAKAPITSTLDSYKFYLERGGMTKEFPAPEGMATIKEGEKGITEITIEAKGLPTSCEFMVYLVDPVNKKIFGIVDQGPAQGYAFKSDEKGIGHFNFTIPVQSRYDTLPVMDLRDGDWRSVDIQTKSSCVGSTDVPQRVLALNLEKIAR